MNQVKPNNYSIYCIDTEKRIVINYGSLRIMICFVA